MDWEFQQRSISGDNDAAAKSRIIIEGDHTITPFEIFVREALQNCGILSPVSYSAEYE